MSKDVSMETKGGGYVVVYIRAQMFKCATVDNRLAMEKTNGCRLRSGTLAQHS